MRYFEAKVLVPLDKGAAKVEQWEGFLLHLYSGFHKGASVEGRTAEWGKEYMIPYFVAIKNGVDSDPGATVAPLVRAAKDIFGQEAVYCAVTELAASVIH
jgi:hypothetical protein